MKRMMMVGLMTAAALAIAPGTQAAQLTAKQVAKIAKRVFNAQIRTTLEPVVGGETVVGHAATADHATTAATAGHAATTGRASTAGHADTAGHATTAGRADSAARADTVAHASTAGHATTAGTAETAEVAGAAESANPMAYALISRDGYVDAQRSSGILQSNIAVRAHAGLYCFFGPVPKGIQVTGIDEPPHAPPVMSARLGRHQNCPDGIAFYVRASEGAGVSMSGFFLSLVL